MVIFLADIDNKMEEYLGNMGVSMDGRFASIRTMETNLGNYINKSFFSVLDWNSIHTPEYFLRYL